MDVLLRIFHQTFAGCGVRRNLAGAEVLPCWPADAVVALQHAIETQETSMACANPVLAVVDFPGVGRAVRDGTRSG
ncbi:hypothetical protein [Streptomyces sp. 8N706]|uniref:hypothetical protein n=1 Tax=Streptomyces sp. 8N706 TaxID=3457416 RepID=UPI003FD14DA3